MRFRVEGTYTRGFSEGPFSIDAPSAEEARRRAEEVGIAVTAVIPAPAGERVRSARFVWPRPDLASGTRTWPQLVTPIPGALVKHFLGIVIALAVAVGVVQLFVLYYQLIHNRVSAFGNGVLLATAVLATSLASGRPRPGTPFWKPLLRLVLVWGLVGAGLFALLGDSWEGRVFMDCLLVMCLLSGAAAVLVRVARLGKRLRAPYAIEKLKWDRAPPILLLRAFQDDRAAIANLNRPQPWWAGGWTVAASPSVTFEEVLCERFSVCGPVVAIGRPRDLVAPLGASRFWVPDALWQRVIDELLWESQLIVMIMGEVHGEDGLAWEVRRIFEKGQGEKLVLVMPPLEEEAVRQRWEKFRSLSQDRLPAYQGGELAAWFADGNWQVARRRRKGAPQSVPSDDEYRGGLVVQS